MQTKDLILGVDGGGTKTVAWLAARQVGQEPSVIGRGASGPSNIQAVGVDEAIRNLEQAISAAFDDGCTSAGTVAAAVLGLAGSDRDANREIFRRWADERRLARRLRVVNDARPIIAAGSPEGWGIGLICGTGSFCFGQSVDGRSTRAGGWGYLFGDEGSGYAIALAGLRAAARSADGRGLSTALMPEMLKRLHLEDPAELIPKIYAMATDRAAIAALADVVTESAARHDEVAGRIVEEAADELSVMVHAVAKKLNLSTSPFPLALTGGALLGSELLLEHLQTRLNELGLHPAPVARVPDPVVGALKMAQADAES